MIAFIEFLLYARHFLNVLLILMSEKTKDGKCKYLSRVTHLVSSEIF